MIISNLNDLWELRPVGLDEPSKTRRLSEACNKVPENQDCNPFRNKGLRRGQCPPQ